MPSKYSQKELQFKTGLDDSLEDLILASELDKHAEFKPIFPYTFEKD